MQNHSASLQRGAISPLTLEILGMWSSRCRVGQDQYMGLSLKVQKLVFSHFSSGNAQINLILHPSMARPEMAFPEAADELGRLHPAAPRGAEGKANPWLAEQGASKQKTAMNPVSDFLMKDPGPNWTGLPLPSTAGWAACHTSRLVIYSQQLGLDQTSPLFFMGKCCNISPATLPFPAGIRYIELLLRICYLWLGKWGKKYSFYIYCQIQNVFCFLWEGNRQSIFNATSFQLWSPTLFSCNFVQENWLKFQIAWFSAAGKW